jgi:uncharacterized protein (DUF433 family)
MLNLTEKSWFDPNTDTQCFRATWDGERITVRVSVEALEDGIGKAEIAKLADEKIRQAIDAGTPVPPEVLITNADRS